MVPALLAAAPYVLSALGGLGHRKNQTMSPEEYQKKFGAQAISSEAQQIMNYILASPYGQSLLGSAAEQGQQFASDTAARAAASGLGPTGASSGADIFAAGAAGGMQNSLERGVKSNVLQAALPIAQQQVQRYGDIGLSRYANDAAQPSNWQKISAAAGQLVPAAGVSQNVIRKPGEEDLNKYASRWASMGV